MGSVRAFTSQEERKRTRSEVNPLVQWTSLDFCSKEQAVYEDNVLTSILDDLLVKLGQSIDDNNGVADDLIDLREQND